MCGWVLGQETPAACPSCSSAAPQCCSHADSAEDTSQGGSREPQPRGAQHEGLSSPCSYSQGALRQTTALRMEETESNHTRITTLPSYWICSYSPSTNIQICPSWSFIWTFLSPGFATSSFFIPLPPLLLLWAPGEHLQCQGLLLQIIQLPSSSLCRKSLEVSFVLQIYPATRWHQDIIRGRVSCIHMAGVRWGSTVRPELCRHSSSKVWWSSRASAHSWGVMCLFLQQGCGFSGASGGTSLEKQREIKK